MVVYAVKVGRTPGIYATWAECSAQVNGYPGAIFKKFTTLAEAQIFIGEERKVPALPPAPLLSGVTPLVAYEVWTDGSADYGKSASYAWVVVKNGTIVNQGGANLKAPPYDSYQGEVFGMMEGLRALLPYFSETKATFTVHCDNEPVVKTLNEWGPARTTPGMWKNITWAEQFINMLQFITAWRAKSNLTIKHVKAHSGLEFNEYVDALATKYRMGST